MVTVTAAYAVRAAGPSLGPLELFLPSTNGPGSVLFLQSRERVGDQHGPQAQPAGGE